MGRCLGIFMLAPPHRFSFISGSKHVLQKTFYRALFSVRQPNPSSPRLRLSLIWQQWLAGIYHHCHPRLLYFGFHPSSCPYSFCSPVLHIVFHVFPAPCLGLQTSTTDRTILNFGCWCCGQVRQTNTATTDMIELANTTDFTFRCIHPLTLTHWL